MTKDIGTDDEWTVYELFCKTSGKSYIGITKNLRRRWRSHLARSKLNTAIANAIRKYGEMAFVVRVITTAVDFREAAAIERGVIAERGTLYPTGYNLSGGGEARFGRAISLETRAKMSASAKARPHPADSAETKARKSAARTKVLSEKPHLRMMIGDFNRGTPKRLIHTSRQDDLFWAYWRKDS